MRMRPPDWLAGVAHEVEHYWYPLIPAVVPIGGLPQAGFAAVRGRVVSGAVCRSPVDGAASVVELLRLHLSAKDAKLEDSLPLLDHATANDFFVEDETGRVLIRTTGARLVLERDRTTALTSLPTALQEKLPAARALWQQDFVGHLAEHLLRPGDPVLVIGELRLETGDDYRGSGRRRVIVSPVPTCEEEMLVVDVSLAKRLRKGKVPPGLSQKLS